ncbi:hypothetical protein PGTUg99_021110 [Puccinia graminis f. sp. tritici]|uniref:Het-C-domain-containing protein n=1 Tax=Puccinia graminis f. sp. tritici TaxID=56615 RepID=A0A5B0M6R8_PUCGR|nr:hypothetical protein PGTUg99_021110 [Puccinia graminis f. sp. tritici]
MVFSCTSCKPMSPSGMATNLFCAIVLISLASSVSAFGSGNIPDAAYLKGKAWRHGDIEDSLEGLVKVAGQGGGAIVGAIASALMGAASGKIGGGSKGGKKFSGLDVKRVYFGNWLRDLSQVCDIAGFKAMTPESLVICIMTMGFLSFGYATREFQVTRERLSVYLLTEHIDNPKGYAEGEDPRKYDPRLRPPVDEARELRIDERNGMKMYIASEDQGFDTSTACIRRVFRQCIELGRQARQEGNEEKEFESFRLLGTGLHTLEDFSAHSNWCELALQKLGHKHVFAHVGENVKVNSPDGPVPPLVTGTFAGADFCFSMLGEASDKLSSASIADLTAQLDGAQDANKKPGGINLNLIKSLLSKLPLGGGSSDVQHDLDTMDEKKHAFDLDGRIDQLAPAELQAKIWDLFKVRDNLMRRIEEIIQGIPGLSSMLENLSLSLAQWIMVTIDPFVRPILLQASSAIGEGSQAVISGNDQWTVFNDPNASDPTHSVLAKDHFSNILNDPAGNVSVIIVKYTVGLMVEAWSNDENPDRVIDSILEAIHHPNFANRNSKIQREMLEYMQKWLNEMDRDDRELTIKSLTKDSIRNHRNQRKTSKGGVDPRLDGGAPSHGHSHPAYQQASMLGGANSQSQYGSASSQSQTQHNSGYKSQSNIGSHSQAQGHNSSQSKVSYGGLQSQTQYDSSQSQGQYGGGSHAGYGHQNSANQGSYGIGKQYESASGRLNQSDRNEGYSKTSSRQNEENYGRATHQQNPQSSGHSGDRTGAYSHGAERKDRDEYPHGHSQSRVSSANVEYGRDSYPRDTGSFGMSHQPTPDHNSGSYQMPSHRHENTNPSSGYASQRQDDDSYNARADQRRNYSAQANTRDEYGDSRPGFPKPHQETSYNDRNDLGSGRIGSGYGSAQNTNYGGHADSYSKPGFPQAHHSDSQSIYGRSDEPADGSFNRGAGSARSSDYDSNPSFPQAQHNSLESPYQNTGSRNDQPAYGAYSGSTDSSYHSSSNYGNPVRDEGRRDEDSGYHNRGSDKHANRHHRSASKDSKSSDDSRGSRKNKHKHDKHKGNKSPDQNRGYQSAYQGGQDNRSYERNNQTDDYGVGRLNMQDEYTRR